MGAGPITFDYNAWIALFPEFTGVASGAAQLYFNIATLYVRNDGGGPINDPNMLTAALNFTTAHLAKIFSAQTNGVSTTGGIEPAPPLVGRISNATEGSVTVSTELPNQQPNAEWWNQTTYGAALWVLLKPYRTFRYVGPTKVRVYNPPYISNSPWGCGWPPPQGWPGWLT